jgi:hypothetical protein
MSAETGHPLPSRILRTAQGRPTRSTRHLVYLTRDEIAFLKAALAHWETANADTSYDPQVQEWARTHKTETETRAASVARALAAGRPEADW